jgi:hypothetical protein
MPFILTKFKGDFIMKKLIVFALVISIMTLAFAGCASTPKCFTGEWKFSKLNKVEVSPNAYDFVIEELMNQYGVEDKDALAASAFADFNENNTFAVCYINFAKKYTYTYDTAMEREATWFFYQTGDNEGFLSFYEIEEVNGNPDPAIHPSVVYNADTNTMYLTFQHVAYTVTIELSR